DDVAERRPEAGVGAAGDLSAERPEHVPGDPERSDAPRDGDDQDAADQARDRVGDRQLEPGQQEPDHVQYRAHRPSVRARCSGPLRHRYAGRTWPPNASRCTATPALPSRPRLGPPVSCWCSPAAGTPTGPTTRAPAWWTFWPVMASPRRVWTTRSPRPATRMRWSRCCWRWRTCVPACTET